jgi:hypothetical protein
MGHGICPGHDPGFAGMTALETSYEAANNPKINL